jgi:integrase
VNRLPANPFARMKLADQEADKRRPRRALTDDELARLVEAARRQPLLDALTVHRGSRKGEAAANVRPDVRERLERVGRERALIFRTLVLTGLRRGELASLTVSNLDLDDRFPCINLDAGETKNGEAATLPLRAELAADLAGWLDDKLAALQSAALAPARLPAGTPEMSSSPVMADPPVRIRLHQLSATGVNPGRLLATWGARRRGMSVGAR